MACRKTPYEDRKMSTATLAGDYVRRMVAHEAHGWGDQGAAQQRLGMRYGISWYQLDHLRTGQAKTVDAGLFARIRAAHLDLCERQVVNLQHEIAVERALNEDDTLADLEREAAHLAARISAKKARLK